MKKTTIVLLSLIFAFALFLRFWKLDKYPEAIDEDEMALGYYAYSLIHSGTDEYGHKFPIYFESVGDYKYGLYSYFDVVPIFLFGLNPVTARSISVVAGALSVVAIFFLACEILKNEEYGLIAAFVLTINPTHIHFSRVAYSNILGALLAITSITLFLRWIKGNSFRYALFSFLFFVLSIYSYQSYRIFLPVVYVLTTLIFFKNLGKMKIAATLFSVLVVISVAASFIPAVSRARSSNLSALVNVPLLTEQISEDGLAGVPPLVARVFDNKVVTFSLGYISRYFDYFSPDFLFVATSTGTARHTIPGVGLLLLIEAPFILISLLYVSKFVQDEKKYIPLILIFSSPLAAAMVDSSTSTTRAVVLVYGTSLLTAIGIYSVLELNRKFSKIILSVILVFFGLNFLYFFQQYAVHKIYHHPWYSDVGLKEMISDINLFSPNYKNVIITGGHYIPYLFYNKILPHDFVTNSEFNVLAQANGVKVKRFGKIIFNMPDCPTAGKKNVLYICFGYKVPKSAKLIDVIRYRDGQPAITLVEFVGIRKSPEILPERVEYSEDVDARFRDGILPDNYENFWPI